VSPPLPAAAPIRPDELAAIATTYNPSAALQTPPDQSAPSRGVTQAPSLLGTDEVEEEEVVHTNPFNSNWMALNPLVQKLKEPKQRVPLPAAVAAASSSAAAGSTMHAAISQLFEPLYPTTDQHTGPAPANLAVDLPDNADNNSTWSNRKTCNHPSCTATSHTEGKCRKHSLNSYCQFDGCNKFAVSDIHCRGCGKNAVQLTCAGIPASEGIESVAEGTAQWFPNQIAARSFLGITTTQPYKWFDDNRKAQTVFNGWRLPMIDPVEEEAKTQRRIATQVKRQQKQLAGQAAPASLFLSHLAPEETAAFIQDIGKASAWFAQATEHAVTSLGANMAEGEQTQATTVALVAGSLITQSKESDGLISHGVTRDQHACAAGESALYTANAAVVAAANSTESNLHRRYNTVEVEVPHATTVVAHQSSFQLNTGGASLKADPDQATGHTEPQQQLIEDRVTSITRYAYSTLGASKKDAHMVAMVEYAFLSGNVGKVGVCVADWTPTYTLTTNTTTPQLMTWLHYFGHREFADLKLAQQKQLSTNQLVAHVIKSQGIAATALRPTPNFATFWQRLLAEPAARAATPLLVDPTFVQMQEISATFQAPPTNVGPIVVVPAFQVPSVGIGAGVPPESRTPITYSAINRLLPVDEIDNSKAPPDQADILLECPPPRVRMRKRPNSVFTTVPSHYPFNEQWIETNALAQEEQQQHSASDGVEAQQTNAHVRRKQAHQFTAQTIQAVPVPDDCLPRQQLVAGGADARTGTGASSGAGAIQGRFVVKQANSNEAIQCKICKQQFYIGYYEQHCMASHGGVLSDKTDQPLTEPSFVVFACEHHCGFEGAYATVATHEVRCAFFGRNLHSKMPLVPTPLLRLKRAGVWPT
jgi:hypothetical protein